MSDEPSAGGSPEASGEAEASLRERSPKKPGKKARPPEAHGAPAVRPVTAPQATSKSAKTKPAQGSRKAETQKRSADPSGSPAAKLPVFARAYPRDPELDALVDAFEAGNYARVREGAERLAGSAERDEVRRAARDLRRRVDPDPLMIYLLLAATALLVVLAVHYWTHQNGSP